MLHLHDLLHVLIRVPGILRNIPQRCVDFAPLLYGYEPAIINAKLNIRYGLLPDQPRCLLRNTQNQVVPCPLPRHSSNLHTVPIHLTLQK